MEDRIEEAPRVRPSQHGAGPFEVASGIIEAFDGLVPHRVDVLNGGVSWDDVMMVAGTGSDRLRAMSKPRDGICSIAVQLAGGATYKDASVIFEHLAGRHVSLVQRGYAPRNVIILRVGEERDGVRGFLVCEDGQDPDCAELVAYEAVDSYNEPFAGSLAVLLGRPTAPRIETVNDLDCYLANFWRALQADPDGVAYYADWPVNEADLHARHRWLVESARAHVDRVRFEPDFYDVKIAGWWVWGQCLWIGSGWCEARRAPSSLSRPENMTTTAKNVHRKRPKLRESGDDGVAYRRWQGGGQGGGSGVHAPRLRNDGLRDYLGALAARLRRVRVCCGDWRRVLTPSVTTYIGTTGVLLDPPYAQDLRERCYSEDHNISAAVRAWALEHGDDTKMRIALCGYEGEHEMPADWACVAWKAHGGYSRTARGRANRDRERVWFSPHCQRGGDLPLFEVGAE